MPSRSSGWSSTLRIRILVSAVIAAILLPAVAGGADDAGNFRQFAHSVWTLQNGAFNRYPRSLTQTSNGYLWLGTEDGVLRFDGTRFTALHPPDRHTRPNSAVARVLATRDGSLWMGTTKGLIRINGHIWTEYPALAGEFVGTLLETRDGVVWAGTSGGLDRQARLCSIGPTAVQCHGGDGRLGRFVSSLYEDADGALWVGAASGLWRWDRDSPRVFSVPYTFPEIHAIAEDADRTLVVAINHGLHGLVDGRLEPYRVAGLPRLIKPTSLLRDRDGALWIGRQDQGLLRVRGSSVDVFGRNEGLSGDFVTDLSEDREGNIWVATTQGLDRLRRIAVSRVGSARTVSVIARQDGSTWFGTVSGLQKWFADGRRLHDPPGTVAAEVASLHEDRRGRVWMSSPRGLAYLDHGVVRQVGGIAEGYIHAIADDAGGNVWVADQERGLLRLRDGVIAERTPWETFGGRHARSLVGSPTGSGVWLGFFQGGIAFFADGKPGPAYGVADGMGRGAVSALALDDDGSVWASTAEGASLVKGGRIYQLTGRQGLPCDVVHWMIRDDAQAWWFYTRCGLVRITGQALQRWLADPARPAEHTLFNDADGVVNLSDVGSYGPKVAKSIDGRLWFTTDLGVSVVDPARLPFNSLPPPVIVEQVTADAVSYEPALQPQLPARVRDLRIDYTALSLAVPERIRFKYRLEGRDREWVDAGNRRQAFYTDLAPGSYRFHVAAANDDGVWNEAGATWAFSIPREFHQTTPFRAGVFAAAGVVLWSLYQLRMRQVSAAMQMRFEERLAERTRIAQELHDTLLQSFVSASMHLHLIADELSDDRVRPRLDTVLERIRDGIEEGRRTVSGLRTAVAASLEQALTSDAEYFRGEQPVDVHVVVEGTRVAPRPLVRDEMYRVLREALANAFRHARATRVTIEFEYAPRYLRCCVRDNGRGMDAAVLQRGRPGHWGVKGMRERADLIGARLTIWSRIDYGTDVELYVPADKAFDRSVSSGAGWWEWWRRWRLT